MPSRTQPSQASSIARLVRLSIKSPAMRVGTDMDASRGDILLTLDPFLCATVSPCNQLTRLQSLASMDSTLCQHRRNPAFDKIMIPHSEGPPVGLESGHDSWPIPLCPRTFSLDSMKGIDFPPLYLHLCLLSSISFSSSILLIQSPCSNSICEYT